MREDEKKHTDEDAGFMSIPSKYINSVRIGNGLYEFQLILSTASVNLLDKESKMLVSPQFIAQMSPQHFKIFTGLLNKQLEKYEKEFGSINVPDSPENQE